MKENKYIVGVERLVDPIEVSNLHFIQNFTGNLPLGVQRKMVQSSAKKTPMMGFVVEPYSYYLGYEIKDIDKASKLLPKGYRLMKSKMYQTDTPKYYGIFGIFNAHTSGFWGLRTEFYLIAEHIESKMISWIIVDYDTNTISYDPKNGIVSPNASGSIFTIDYNGIIHIDIHNEAKDRGLTLQSDITKGNKVPLDKDLWINGNLSIGYGIDKTYKDGERFSLVFDPEEFKEAILIDSKDCNIVENSWFNDIIEESPSTIMCFPYAQHFLSDSPGSHSSITTQKELEEAVKQTDFSLLKVFSTKQIMLMLASFFGISVAINITLLILLFMK